MLKNHTRSVLYIAAAIAVPGVASADSLYHPANDEAGYVAHYDHAKSTKSRAQVAAEVDAARKDGTYSFYRVGAPLPARLTGAGKTREQVIAELMNETPQQRSERMSQLLGR